MCTVTTRYTKTTNEAHSGLLVYHINAKLVGFCMHTFMGSARIHLWVLHAYILQRCSPNVSSRERMRKKAWSLGPNNHEFTSCHTQLGLVMFIVLIDFLVNWFVCLFIYLHFILHSSVFLTLVLLGQAISTAEFMSGQVFRSLFNCRESWVMWRQWSHLVGSWRYIFQFMEIFENQNSQRDPHLKDVLSDLFVCISTGV